MVAINAVAVVGMEHLVSFVQLISLAIYAVTVWSCTGKDRLFDFNYSN